MLLPPYAATISGSLQSKQAIFTARVALTLIPQQGQMYFLVLDFLLPPTVFV
jgi:hypothetical protein